MSLSNLLYFEVGACYFAYDDPQDYIECYQFVRAEFIPELDDYHYFFIPYVLDDLSGALIAAPEIFFDSTTLYYFVKANFVLK